MHTETLSRCWNRLKLTCRRASQALPWRRHQGDRVVCNWNFNCCFWCFVFAVQGRGCRPELRVSLVLVLLRPTSAVAQRYRLVSRVMSKRAIRFRPYCSAPHLQSKPVPGTKCPKIGYLQNVHSFNPSLVRSSGLEASSGGPGGSSVSTWKRTRKYGLLSFSAALKTGYTYQAQPAALGDQNSVRAKIPECRYFVLWQRCVPYDAHVPEHPLAQPLAIARI